MVVLRYATISRTSSNTVEFDADIRPIVGDGTRDPLPVPMHVIIRESVTFDIDVLMQSRVPFYFATDLTEADLTTTLVRLAQDADDTFLRGGAA